MNYLKDFQNLDSKCVAIAGGKGASLGEMTQAGIPVPPGFVILSESFEKFLVDTDLNIEINSILSKVNVKEMHTIENASEKIQALILSADMPSDIASEILENYQKLGSKFVAVRSSATSEDSASAAWAGQLDTFLNTTETDLLENVQKCWASLFTPRAIFYRFELLERGKMQNETHANTEDHISVAVVIQKMIQSEKSGIAFSVHPVTQDENQLIIEAGLGLGEAIVSGSVTPDSYVVSKEDLQIIDINISEQGRALYKKENGGNEWRDLGEEGKKQVLSKKEIIELSKLIIKIEKHYGFPCDIEWAFENGEFFITQSRPITTLLKKTKKEVYIPFGRLVASRARSKKVITPFPAIYTQEYVSTLDMEKIYGTRAHATVLTWIGDDITTSTDSNEEFEKIGKIIVDKSLLDKKWLNGIIEWSEKQKNELKIFIEDSFPINNLFSLSNKNIADNYFEYYKKYRNFHLNNTPSWWIGSSILENRLDEYVQKGEISKNDLAILIEPLEYFFDLNNEEKEIIEIAVMLKKIKNISEENIPEDVDKLLNKHVESYSSIPFAYISGVLWNKNFFIKKIKDIILEGDPSEFLLKKNKELELKRQKRNELNKKLDLNPQLMGLIETTKKLSYLQDLKKVFQTRSHPHLQLVVLPEIARRLKIDIKYMCHLDPYEIRDSLISGEVSKKISLELPRRINNSILISENNEYKWILEEDAIEFAKKYKLIISDENIIELKGSSASSGKVKGIVKICETSMDILKVEKNDVLVAAMTTPDYVPAMKIAGAIVTNEGGITCHAAIVSRELNIPCVIGTKNATKILKDGDLVEVDADNGVVRILEKKQ